MNPIHSYSAFNQSPIVEGLSPLYSVRTLFSTTIGHAAGDENKIFKKRFSFTSTRSDIEENSDGALFELAVDILTQLSREKKSAETLTTLSSIPVLEQSGTQDVLECIIRQNDQSLLQGEALSLEMLFYIIQFLNFQDMMRLASTCKKMSESIFAFMRRHSTLVEKYLEKVLLHPTPHFSLQRLQHVTVPIIINLQCLQLESKDITLLAQTCPQIQKIAFVKMNKNDSSLKNKREVLIKEAFKTCKQVKEVVFDQVGVIKCSTLGALHNLSSLQKVILQDSCFRKEHLEKLVKVKPDLSSLTLQSLNLRNKSLLPICEISHLQELRLKNILIKGDVLERITKACTGIKQLQLANVAYVDSAAFSSIANLTQLHELNVSGTPISNTAFKSVIEKCSSLVKLCISYCYKIDSTGLEKISRLEKLTELYAERTSFTGSSFGIVASAIGKNVQILDLSSCTQLEKQDFAFLYKFRHLKRLDLCHTTLSNESLDSFDIWLPELESLSLAIDKGISIDHIRQLLPKLSKLTSLFLSTSDGVNELLKLQRDFPRISINKNLL